MDALGEMFLQNVLGHPDKKAGACANNTKPSSHDGAPPMWGHYCCANNTTSKKATEKGW